MSTGERLRVLVVEDQRLQAESIGAALERFGGFAVRLSASAAQAVQHLEAELPDVALFDIGLADGDGVDLTAHTTARWPEVRVCMLTGRDDSPTIARAISAGASGYLLKTATPEEIVGAVRRVAAGEVIVPSAALPALLAGLVPSGDPAGRARTLSAAELDVLRGLARGCTPSVIAREMGVSIATVRGRLRALYAKLEVSSRLQAVARARDLGLLGPTGRS